MIDIQLYCFVRRLQDHHLPYQGGPFGSRGVVNVEVGLGRNDANAAAILHPIRRGHGVGPS